MVNKIFNTIKIIGTSRFVLGSFSHCKY